MFASENTIDSAIANRTVNANPLNKVYNGIPFHHKRTSDIQARMGSSVFGMGNNSQVYYDQKHIAD